MCHSAIWLGLRNGKSSFKPVISQIIKEADNSALSEILMATHPQISRPTIDCIFNDIGNCSKTESYDISLELK